MSISIVDESGISAHTIATLYYSFYRELRDKQGLPCGSVEDYEKEIKELIKGGNKFFIALIDNDPAGFVRISEREGAYWIEEIFVKPKYRGQGLGRILVEEAEKYIKERDDAAYIMVLPQELSTIKFWLHMGYKMLNTIELVKYLNNPPKTEETRILEVFGFPLLIWRWEKEEYDELELEFLSVLKEFFSKYDRVVFLRVIIYALKRALKNEKMD